MSSGVQCQCGSTDIDTDPSRGDSVCTQCGSVLEESNIVTEVQYVPDSHGVTRAVGQLVSFEDGMPMSLGHRLGFGSVSRNITLHNAKQNIQSLASRLNLKPHSIETAFNFYKVALSRQLTKGRKSTHVIAACVYMVCRKEGTSHMLLDLSDILKINVYELGKTYLKLSAALCINTPAIDPVLYIARFSRQLEFGDKENEVALTAAKLVRRMKSDWINIGRRPSGLCGAALLVAARLHNFSRTIEDIIKVVKVCQGTVRKRLNEFGDTPSGKLSIEDFLTVDLSEEQDPPSFKNARKKLRELEDDTKILDLKKQVTEIRKEIERALESTKRKSRWSKYDDISETNNTAEPSESSGSKVDQIIAETIAEQIKDVLNEDDDSNESMVCNLTPVFLKDSENTMTSVVLAGDEDVNWGMGMEPTAESIGLKDSIEECMQIPEPKDGEQDNRLDLNGLDDNELDIYFMKPFEYQRKDEFWHKHNADYLKEQKEREERRALEEEENAKKPPKRRRVKRRGRIQATTAGEAIEKMLQQKKISFKLNYDVLKSLNPENVSEAKEEPKELDTLDVIFRSGPSLPKTSKRKQRPKPTVPLNIKKGMSDIVGNNRRKVLAALAEEQSSSQEPLEKKPKIDESQSKDVEDAVIIENGPIDDNPNIEPEELEEDELEQGESDDEIFGFPKEDTVPDYYGYDDYVDDYED